MSLDEIISEIKEISEFTATWYNKDQGHEMSERLTNLNVYLSRSAVLQSEAQALVDIALANETEKIADKGYTPTIITNIAKGKVATELKLWKLCERINRTITHQIDSIRTQLSYLKSHN